jgi:predicted ATP-binding protein involved in virulence
LRNFKKFEELTLDLHPRFTVLVGDNGSGKTTLLDALAVSLGIWLVDPPDSGLKSSGRNIRPAEIRLVPSQVGDRVQFREARPVVIQATGQIGDRQDVTWAQHEGRRFSVAASRIISRDIGKALNIIQEIYRRDADGEAVLCPVLAYYGAGRAWLSSRQRMPPEAKSNGPARRWAAFYDCFNERIRFDELRKWFHRETTAAGNRGGRMRPGFLAVRQAVLGCVPEADGLWFDPDREQIVLSIDGEPQPFENLSAGQRMMLALVADIAIKAVTQNAHLFPPDELTPEDEPLARLLQKTPGVVLIDELDVHLHPRWQRRVPADLKRTFPGIQFVCTSHSPQVIGEVTRDEVRLLRPDGLTPPPVAPARARTAGPTGREIGAQGIGLWPHPWAPFSRPNGPAARASRADPPRHELGRHTMGMRRYGAHARVRSFSKVKGPPRSTLTCLLCRRVFVVDRPSQRTFAEPRVAPPSGGSLRRPSHLSWARNEPITLQRPRSSTTDSSPFA